jgi:hypothetical protein
MLQKQAREEDFSGKDWEEIFCGGEIKHEIDDCIHS